MTGPSGTEIFSVLNGKEERIGVSCGKQLGKGKFTELYPGWVGSNVMINNDVGLVEVDDLSIWKTEVFGIGLIDEMKDVTTNNMTLDLINKKVVGYGAVSREMRGEIVAFFYRYKSLGGIEYVSDYLIGGTGKDGLNTHHGDSGTLWLLEEEDPDTGKLLRRPLALHWGQHEFLVGKTTRSRSYAMATSLSNICRELDVDLLRDWNLDQDYTWAKDGHFKVGNRAADLIGNTKLAKLLQLNQSNLGYDDATLKKPEKVAKAKSENFIPLADVADLWWRYKRFKTEGSNHFADMDEKNSKVASGKDLLSLCKNESFIDIRKWINFYEAMDKVDPKTKIDRDTKEEVPAPREGSLPFRVWQMYSQMVNSLKAGKVDEYICAGGTMAHYVGDACQPLHVSYLHAGIPGKETKVHGDYEDSMLAKNRDALFNGVNAIKTKVKVGELIKGGKAAAQLTVKLMGLAHKTLPPMEIINVFGENSGRGKYERAWAELGEKTIQVIAAGAHCMAVLWESAWVEGDGNKIPASKIKKSAPASLQKLYEDYHFVQSYNLKDPKFKVALNKDSRLI